MKQLFSLLAFLFIFQLTKAQEFLTPLETLTGKVQVTTVDGKTVYGKLTSVSFEARGLGNFRVKDSATDEVIKFTPENVKTLQVKMTFNNRMETIEKQSMFKLLKSKGKEVSEREYITFNLVTYPEKKDKILLLQLLNPDFSSKIQVYEHKVGGKSSTSILGIETELNEATSFIIVINGVSSFVEKKKYKTDYFDKIFASCPELMAMPEKEVSFSDFAKHVSIFEKCK
jgi:hypothetical protein